MKGNAEKGFTLLEAMIASAVLVLILIGIFQAVSLSVLMSNLQHNRAVALNLAQQKLEQTAQQTFANIAAGTTSTVYTGELSSCSLTVTTTVTNVDDAAFVPLYPTAGNNPAVDYKLITVVATWRQLIPRDLGNQTITLSKYVTPHVGTIGG